MLPVFTTVGAVKGFKTKDKTRNKTANDLIVELMPFFSLSYTPQNKKCHFSIIEQFLSCFQWAHNNETVLYQSNTIIINGGELFKKICSPRSKFYSWELTPIGDIALIVLSSFVAIWEYSNEFSNNQNATFFSLFSVHFPELPYLKWTFNDFSQTFCMFSYFSALSNSFIRCLATII